MASLLVVVIVVALLVVVVSTLVFIVAAFRQSALWGLAILFIPGAAIVFTIRYWSEVKTSFLVNLASSVIVCVGIMMHPSTSKGLAASSGLSLGKSGRDTGAELTAKIQERRDRIEQLQAAFDQGGPIVAKQFSELEKKRKSLKANDVVAVNQFNEEAAAYQQQNTRRKVMLQEIETARQDLNDLLAERTKIAAAAPGSGNGQRVVMYTTARCPACKAAKQYMTKRGISYDERDVEATKSNYAEFKQLGGTGVPLILVGDKRMEGFNPRALDEML
ncbi:glutaredoxin domain-containing protein [Verrucomicrobiota bacterium sgz303538]